MSSATATTERAIVAERARRSRWLVSARSATPEPEKRCMTLAPRLPATGRGEGVPSGNDETLAVDATELWTSGRFAARRRRHRVILGIGEGDPSGNMDCVCG